MRFSAGTLASRSNLNHPAELREMVARAEGCGQCRSGWLLDPDSPAEGRAVKRSDVPRREDVGVRGPQQLIDFDPVVHRESDGCGELHVRTDPDPGDHTVNQDLARGAAVGRPRVGERRGEAFLPTWEPAADIPPGTEPARSELTLRESRHPLCTTR
jgi:hypothetical protein